MKKMRRKEFKIPEILVMRMILSFGFLFGSLITLNASPNFGQNVLTTQKKNVSTESEYSKSVAPKSGEQTVTIRGKVLDASGQPLPGANISIVGTTTGVITDAEGYYNIAAKQGDVLKFSYIGYKEQQVQVAKKTSIDVVLTENLSTLEETVVVGMGKQRRASVVGAISTIAVNDLRVPTRSLTNALSGKVAGAVIVQRTGEIGNDDPSFWIRGISTFGSNRSPLILVDGVERSMDNIPVEEVESVSILKDASATAVYGVRAANGVVIVTTRKGVAQKPAVELKIEQGVSDLPGMPKFLDGANYATLYNEAYGHENYSPDYITNLQTKADPYLYPNVNWFNETYKKYSTNQQTTVNVRGGGEVARYFVSFGYLGEDGNLKNSPLNDYKSNLNLNRYNFRSNVDITLNKTLEMSIEAGGYLSDLHTPGLGNTIYSQYYSPAQELYYWSYLSTPVSCPVKVPIGKDSNGNYIMGWGAPTQVGEKNPAERLFGSGYNTTYSNQILTQVTLKQDLKKLLNGLKFQTSFSFDAYNQTNIRRTKAEATYGVQGRDATTNEIIVKP
ncbi:MAG: SusC/RagA family TonB-linked outer membrane protein, partial [Bacteroidota bacterium]|nr:SusC/RagA family TonB-linked outer membrane protein [Bacteroidota bacterium]